MRLPKLFTIVICVVLLVLLASGALLMSGCKPQLAETSTSEEAVVADEPFPAIKVGTLQTDDLLPLWVAQAEGLLDAVNLKNVEIITFQSPLEQRAAIEAGEIDALMTDMAVPPLLTSSGVSVRAVTIMQGMPAGIVAAPGSGITSLSDLEEVPVAISSPTIIEYLVDTALADAYVPDPAIQYEIVEKLPVRLEMLMAGKVKAAGLPWTLVALAEKQGAKVLFDREAAKEYPATVLCFTQDFLDGKPASGVASSPEAARAAIVAMLGAWDQAVEKINANPDAYRALLVEKANLPAPLAESYPVPTYPPTGMPDRAQWESVLDWMWGKGYIPKDITYDDLVFDATR